MKTQIITLESHDDLISVRDRMSWAKTPRILLVWPKYETITLRYVDLKVLQRHASTLGAQVGLVTRQRRVRAEAESLGIPVFTSTGEAQRVSWPKVKRRRFPHKAPDKTLREKREQTRAREAAWRSNPVIRILLFSIGVLAVLAVAALFIPSARIRLDPVTQTQSIEIPVTASPLIEEVFISGNIPAREKRVVVDGVQRILVTGESSVPESKAKGVVTFRNLTQNDVTIPTGTVVSSNGIRFTTTDSGTLSAGLDETLNLPVEAVEGGTTANLPADSINIVEGRLALSLAVNNAEATQGGRERASIQATDADRATVKELLSKKLQTEALEQMTGEMKRGEILFNETLAHSQTVSEIYDPPPGAAGAQLTLTMQDEYTARYADASDLTQLASLALNASIAPGFVPTTGPLTFESISAPVLLDDGSLQWTMRAERQIAPVVDGAFVTSLIRGLLKSSVNSRLKENLPAMDSVEVTTSPSWWPWMPVAPFRIEVVTE